jgi:hypothetical protein
MVVTSSRSPRGRGKSQAPSMVDGRKFDERRIRLQNARENAKEKRGEAYSILLYAPELDMSPSFTVTSPTRRLSGLMMFQLSSSAGSRGIDGSSIDPRSVLYL